MPPTRLAAASSTAMQGPMTSWPIPSPGRTAIRKASLADMRFPERRRSGSLRLRPQRVEVAAFVGEKHFVAVEAGIAPLRLEGRDGHRLAARLHLGLVDEEFDAAFLHRDPDPVAVLHEGERAAGGRV